MVVIKKFAQFVNENYLDTPADPNIMEFDFDKMKENGYTEVTVEKPIEDLEKGDIVLVDASEFGTLDDDAIVTCYTKEGDEVAIPKQNLKVEETEPEDDDDDEDGKDKDEEEE